MYASYMESGEWLENGDTIRFDWNGMLLDGQHRLEAIVKSGIPQMCLVVRNLDPKVFDSIDQGIRRTNGDALNARQVPNANVHAAALTTIYKYQAGRLFSSENLKLPNAKLSELHAAHPGLSASVTRFLKVTIMSPGVLAGLHYLFSRGEHAELADTFMHELTTGESGSAAGVVYVLREHLQRQQPKSGKRATRLQAAGKAELVVKAWNAYVAGGTVTSLRRKRKARNTTTIA
jgi:hypothetical protein